MTRRLWIILLLIIYATSILTQTFGHGKNDVLWLMHCTQVWLNGGHYYTDFFETNPPLILVLNIPAVWLMKYLSLSTLTAFLIVLYSAISGVLWLSYYISQCLYHNDIQSRRWLILCLAFALLIVPVVSFGEREHWALVLITPYLLTTAALLTSTVRQSSSQQNTFSLYFRMAIALLAGAGFSLKPYFLPAIISVELLTCWTLFRHRMHLHPQSWITSWLKSMVRLEPIVILSFMILYLLWIATDVPQYFQHVLPLAEALYVPFFDRKPLLQLLTTGASAVVLLGLAWSGLYLRSITPSSLLLKIMAIAALGFWLGALYAGQIWYYHFYPAIALVILTNTLAIKPLLAQWQQQLSVRHFSWVASWLLLVVFEMTVLALFTYLMLLPTQVWKDGRSLSAIMAFAKQHPHATVMLFNMDFAAWTLFTQHAHLQVVGRFPSQLLVPGIRTLELEHEPTALAYKHQVIGLTVSDLQQYHPQFLFIATNAYLLSTTAGPYSLHLLPFFLSNSAFRAEFAHYHSIGRVGEFAAYASNA